MIVDEKTDATRRVSTFRKNWLQIEEENPGSKIFAGESVFHKLRQYNSCKSTQCQTVPRSGQQGCQIPIESWRMGVKFYAHPLYSLPMMCPVTCLSNIISTTTAICQMHRFRGLKLRRNIMCDLSQHLLMLPRRKSFREFVTT
jgi:hypothetical protein